MSRDKINLDITWLRDESLEDADNLPAPEIIAREIVEDLWRAASKSLRISDGTPRGRRLRSIRRGRRPPQRELDYREPNSTVSVIVRPVASPAWLTLFAG